MITRGPSSPRSNALAVVVAESVGLSFGSFAARKDRMLGTIPRKRSECREADPCRERVEVVSGCTSIDSLGRSEKGSSAYKSRSLSLRR